MERTEQPERTRHSAAIARIDGMGAVYVSGPTGHKATADARAPAGAEAAARAGHGRREPLAGADRWIRGEVYIAPTRETAMAKRRVALVLAGLIGGLVLATGASALEVGDKAPEFTLAGPGGKQVKLSELTAKGPVVLYTFIQAFTGT